MMNEPPGYQEMADAAHWNPWFGLTLAIPLLILLPPAIKRWRYTFCLTPVALLGFWGGFLAGCAAIRSAHWAFYEQTGYLATADTGLVFAPLVWGVPAAVVCTALATGVALLFHNG